MPTNSPTVNPVVRLRAIFCRYSSLRPCRQGCLRGTLRLDSRSAALRSNAHSVPLPGTGPLAGGPSYVSGRAENLPEIGKIFLGKNSLLCRSLCGIVGCGVLEVVLCSLALVSKRGMSAAQSTAGAVAWVLQGRLRCVVRLSNDPRELACYAAASATKKKESRFLNALS